MIKSSKHLGMIFYGRTWQATGLLCREHARRQLTGDLAFTAVLGWWGVISFFTNIGIVAGQVKALSSLSQLAPPEVTAIAEQPVTSTPAAPEEGA
jgi:hypothetical protein